VIDGFCDWCHIFGVTIERPTIRPITLAEGLEFSGKGYIADEKKDGRFELLNWQGSIIAGERMSDGFFWAFDVANCQGDDCRRSPLTDRREALASLASSFDSRMAIVPSGFGGEFIEAVLRDGGEGVVFKHPEGYWGVGQFKAKRIETFDVRVTEKLRGSVAISFQNQDAGKCPIFGKAFESVKAGDMIEISAFCMTASGKFREPRFVKLRPDKN